MFLKNDVIWNHFQGVESIFDSIHTSLSSVSFWSTSSSNDKSCTTASGWFDSSLTDGWSDWFDSSSTDDWSGWTSIGTGSEIGGVVVVVDGVVGAVLAVVGRRFFCGFRLGFSVDGLEMVGEVLETVGAVVGAAVEDVGGAVEDVASVVEGVDASDGQWESMGEHEFQDDVIVPNTREEMKNIACWPKGFILLNKFDT